VVSEEYYPIGQAEFRPILTRTKSLNPEGFLLIADYPEAAQIISQAREVGMSGFKVYGRGTVVTPEMLKLLQNACWANGAKEANFWAPNEATKDLANRYQARFKEPLTRTSGMGYLGAQTLLQAMKTIQGDINAKSIRDAMEKLDFNLPGLGQVKFDDHHQVHYPMYILSVQNCQVNILETVPTN
jgi:branched-chain amino acid transport system substrate-binding protein